MIYIIYQDNTTYKGGKSYSDLGWSKAPNKPIKQVYLILPDGNFLVMQGCKKYNCFVEVTQNVYGAGPRVPIIENVYLMGIKEGTNAVNSYRVSLMQYKDSKYKIGDITRREYPIGKEFRGQPTIGWKGEVDESSPNNS